MWGNSKETLQVPLGPPVKIRVSITQIVQSHTSRHVISLCMAYFFLNFLPAKLFCITFQWGKKLMLLKIEKSFLGKCYGLSHSVARSKLLKNLKRGISGEKTQFSFNTAQ